MDSDLYAQKNAFGRINATTLIVPGAADKGIRGIGYRLQAEATVTVHFADEDNAQISQKWVFNAREGCCINARGKDDFEFQAPKGLGVKLVLSDTVFVNFTLKFHEVGAGGIG